RSFSSPPHFRKSFCFEPSPKSSLAHTSAMSNLCLHKPLCMEFSHLLIAVIALFTPSQTGTFLTGVWRRLPGFERKGLGTLFTYLLYRMLVFFLHCGFSLFANLCTAMG